MQIVYQHTQTAFTESWVALLCFQCLKCGWAVMDGVQALIFKAGRRAWANAYTLVN